MRLWIAALALLFVGGLGFLLFLGRAPGSPGTAPDTNSPEIAASRPSARLPSPTGSPAVSPAMLVSEPTASATVSAIASTSSPALSEVPPTAESASVPPQVILENMRRVIRQYNSMFGGNPVGTNPEITRALQGDNPKQINFLKPDDGNRVNGNGELVDPWGTPYFFHQLSATDMEIRSAGPDRKMWSDDDLVTR